jgi:uncharacterized protein (DUF362 family)
MGMNEYRVGLARYDAPHESVRCVIDLAGGLEELPRGARVFVKPNIVFWAKSVPFPKWGVITTSRVVEDMVAVLRDSGVKHITIGEGSVLFNPRDRQTQAGAFESLGYNRLKERYGVHVVSVFERPFRRVDLGEGLYLNMNQDILNADFVVDLPVLKTHAQTVASLGIKNIKGTIDIASRKKCHNADGRRDLHYMVSRLVDPLPPCFTLIDGIYSLERGPAFDGRVRRSNILVASSDILSADMVGARLLGHEPADVPHLRHAAARRGRALDCSDVEVRGERVEDLASPHEFSFPYNSSGTLPLSMERMGITGLSYPKYDATLCTYCSILTGAILTSIALAWTGESWDNVEVLTGKTMAPTPGKKTILLGKCLSEAHKNHPDFSNMIAIKTCPPSPAAVIDALHATGIPVNPDILNNIEQAPGYFLKKYSGKPEFDDEFFRIR